MTTRRKSPASRGHPLIAPVLFAVMALLPATLRAQPEAPARAPAVSGPTADPSGEPTPAAPVAPEPLGEEDVAAQPGASAPTATPSGGPASSTRPPPEPPRETQTAAPAEADPRARTAEAVRLLRAGKPDEAAALYEEVLASAPGEVPAQSGLVRALITAGRWREALSRARAFAAAEPGSRELSVALGEALYRAGHLREARELMAPLVGPAIAAPSPGSEASNTMPRPVSAGPAAAPDASAPAGATPSPGSEASNTMPGPVSAGPAAAPDAPTAPPPRALLVLGMILVAEGREEEAALLLDRARALAPDDRDVLFWAAGAAASRRSAVEQLERYLAISEGDDPDRIEGAKGTIGLYRALGERRVWIPVSRPERFEVPMRALLDRDHRPKGYVVDLKGEDGTSISVLVDTGSPGLFLVERAARRAGFTPVADQTTFAGGGEGRTPSLRGLLPSVRLGELRFQDALVSTTAQELEPTGRYHGVLGASILQGYRVTLDFARERLIAVRTDPREEAPPAARAQAGESNEGAGAGSGSRTGPRQGTESAGDPASGSKRAAAEGTEPAPSPYWTVGGQMLTEARSTGAPPALFLFDTGAVKSLLSLDLATRQYAGKLAGPLDLQTFGGAAKGATTVRGVRVEFQGRASDGAALNVADLAQRSRLTGVEVSGFIGMDLLARAVVTIDTVARTVAVAARR